MGARRLVTAAIFLPLFVLYIMKLPPFFFLLLVVFASAAAQMELYTMYRLNSMLKYTGIMFGALLIAVIYQNGNVFGAIALSFITITVIRLFGTKDPSHSLNDTATAIFGLIYIPVLLGYQINIRAEGPEWILFLYGTVWCSDSFAYYIGKAIGKRKLYEAVSPKKTIAGGFGSVLGGAAGALILKAILVQGLSPAIAIASGAITGVVTIIGDLVESMLKRDAGVKDSSTIIPGHGGLLDKMDGALFAAPALFSFLTSTGVF